MSKLSGIMAVLLVAFIVLPGGLHAVDFRSDSCDSYSKEKPPKFRLARQHRNESRQALILHISVAPRDVTQDRLLTLGCSLGRNYANNQALVVLIFDNHRAARRYNPQGEGNDEKMELAYRASYGFDRDDKRQSLDWRPTRDNHESNVEIKLGPPPPVPSP
jgi:hypothetical protein